MTTHVDFTLASGGSASVQFTASPLPMRVTIGRAGETLATFTPGDAATHALPAGGLRVSAFYEMNGQWIPLDVDLNEDTSARAVFRCSAYVGSTITPTGGGGSTKLEALVSVTKS